MGPADRDVTWSNPQGATLTQLKPQVWWGERPFYPRIPGLRGVDVACKMAVVKLRDGTLWVHAPVALDDKTRAAVDALGPVRHVVTPNTEHLKWAKEWLDAYPDATGYACPGLMDARPDIGYDAEVGRGDPPASWLDEFEVAWIEEERSPFKIFGDKPFFSEVVFNHRPSGVLFVADLWWNYPSGGDVPTSSKLWKFGMDQIYRPVYNGLMRQRPAHDAKVKTILEWPTWDFIAPCHGEPIQGPAVKDRLAAHLGVELA